MKEHLHGSSESLISNSKGYRIKIFTGYRIITREREREKKKRVVEMIFSINGNKNFRQKFIIAMIF